MNNGVHLKENLTDPKLVFALAQATHTLYNIN